MSSSNKAIHTLTEEINNFCSQTRKQQGESRDILKGLEKRFSELNSLTADLKLQKKELSRLKKLAVSEEKGGKSGERKSIREMLREGEKEHNAVVSEALPKSNSRFLAAFLGKVNVRVFHLEDKIRMKNQYNRFMWRNAILFVILPLLRLIFDMGPIYKMCHDFWMLYFYVSLALRENILCANGSKIQPWWIYHHYLSAIMAVISATITHPEPAIYRRILQLFVLQGFVMLLQNLYQSYRQYARVATGKASPLDVTITETLVERPTRRRILLVLVPLLFTTYLFEIHVGISITLHCFYKSQYNYPVILMGFAFVAVGVMNMYTVSLVLYNKDSLWSICHRGKTQNKVVNSS